MIKKKQSLTCIAAIKHRGRIYMAADRRASWDFSQAQQMPRPKIVKRDGMILAGTGDSYLCALLVDILEVPPRGQETLDDYMFDKMHRSVTNLLLRKGYCSEHKQLKIPSESSVEVIIAIEGKLYNIVIHNPDPEKEDISGEIMIDELNIPYASGCGGHLAWGSLLTSENLELTPNERLTIALNVAAQVSPGCDNKIDIYHE